MTAISLKAAGATADVGTGSAVDCTGCASLKLAAVMSATLSEAPSLRIIIETASAASGAAWRTLYDQSFFAGMGGSNTWPADSKARIVVEPDNFVRCRWETKTRTNQAITNPDPNNAGTATWASSAGLNLSVTGVGTPDA